MCMINIYNCSAPMAVASKAGGMAEHLCGCFHTFNSNLLTTKFLYSKSVRKSLFMLII